MLKRRRSSRPALHAVGAAALLVLASGGVAVADAPDPGLGPGPNGVLLGVHDHNGQPDKIADFIGWLDPDGAGVVTGWQEVIRRNSWDTIEMDTPWDRGVLREVRDWVLERPGRWVNWSMAILPDGYFGRLGDGAAGKFDERFTNLANNLAKEGLADPAIPVIFRPGYEWDAGWFPWGVDNDLTEARHFAEFWRRIVTAMREAQPDANWMFDWNPNHGAYRSGELLAAAWPGSDYVDFVGIDIYDRGGDHRPCDDVEPRWQWAERRLDRARDFAIAKGKPLSIPEWGIWNSGCDPDEWGAGTDNAYHVERMHEWLTANAEHVHYHVYFNELRRHRLNPPTDSPDAGARFKELFGSAGK